MRRISGLLVFLSLFLAGCGVPDTPAYDPGAFSCLLSVDSVSTGEAGRFTAEYTRDGSTATLTLTAPERLAGMKFSFTEQDCTLLAEDCAIPLSTGAAASLRELTDLLGSQPADASDSRMEEGCTVLTFDAGQLTLNADGLPVFLETADGRRAQVILPEDGQKQP